MDTSYLGVKSTEPNPRYHSDIDASGDDRDFFKRSRGRTFRIRRQFSGELCGKPNSWLLVVQLKPSFRVRIPLKGDDRPASDQALRLARRLRRQFREDGHTANLVALLRHVSLDGTGPTGCRIAVHNWADGEGLDDDEIYKQVLAVVPPVGSA